MRDPKRIPKILERLRILWEKYPDLRLGQLIGNMFPREGTGYPRIKFLEAGHAQQYYIEDEDLIKILESFYLGVKNAKKLD